MRIALLSPLPPEQTGIADYAWQLCTALRAAGLTVLTPFQEEGPFDWSSVDLVHAELGGGRFREFNMLVELSERYPNLPLTATVHDPERLIWRREHLPRPLRFVEKMPALCQQAATLVADPVTLAEERRLARKLSRLVTLTQTGAECLGHRMKLEAEKCTVIPHGNLVIPPHPLPPLPLKLLYFGFIYRGKGIEDLLDGLAEAVQRQPDMRDQITLTLAGGTAPEVTFGGGQNYLETLVDRIDSLGLKEVIEWQLDLPAEEIPHIIQSHHVMVLPYRESRKLAWLGQMRGTSGALSWANACGRGVITSNARAFVEEISSGNGDWFQQGDVTSLADALNRLFADPSCVQGWAEKAARQGEARQWQHTATAFKQLFTQVCRGTSP